MMAIDSEFRHKQAISLHRDRSLFREVQVRCQFIFIDELSGTLLCDKYILDFFLSHKKISPKCTEFNGSSGKMDATHCQMLLVQPSPVMSHHFPKEDSPKPFSSELPASLRKIAERETHVFVSGMNFKTYQLQQGFIWSVISPGWRKFKVPIAVHVALSQDKVGTEGSKLSSSAG